MLWEPLGFITFVMKPARMRSFVCFLLIVLFTSSFSVTAQPKGYLYDESKVAPYELPDPMVCLDGTKVTDSKTWLKKRRPEVLRLFEEEVYGRSPGKPKEMHFEVVEEGVEALGGKATQAGRDPSGQGKKALAVNLLLYLPQKAKGPRVLTIIVGNHSVCRSAIRIPASWVRNGTGSRITKQPPMAGVPGLALGNDTIIERGYTFATVYYGDIDPDFTTDMKMGQPLFSPKDPERQAH